eukprot:Clim_evm34s242 gene=Clim_evmTU34s242
MRSSMGSANGGTPVGEDEPMPAVAIVGTGKRATLQYIAAKSAGFEVAAVWGRTRNSLATFIDEHPANLASTDLEYVLREVAVPSVIVICTPPHTHADYAIKAINLGHHVLIEKPIALTRAEALSVLNAVQQNDRRLCFVCCAELFSPKVRLLQAILEASVLTPAMQRRNADTMNAAIDSEQTTASSILPEEHGYYIGELQYIKAEVMLPYPELSTDGTFRRYNWRDDAIVGGGVLRTEVQLLVDILVTVLPTRILRASGLLRTCKQSLPAPLPPKSLKPGSATGDITPQDSFTGSNRGHHRRLSDDTVLGRSGALGVKVTNTTGDPGVNFTVISSDNLVCAHMVTEGTLMPINLMVSRLNPRPQRKGDHADHESSLVSILCVGSEGSVELTEEGVFYAPFGGERLLVNTNAGEVSNDNSDDLLFHVPPTNSSPALESMWQEVKETLRAIAVKKQPPAPLPYPASYIPVLKGSLIRPMSAVLPTLETSLYTQHVVDAIAQSAQYSRWTEVRLPQLTRKSSSTRPDWVATGRMRSMKP